MKLDTTSHRLIGGALVASIALASLAAPAFAGHGRGGWKHRRGDDSRAAYGECSRPVVVERRESCDRPTYYDRPTYNDRPTYYDRRTYYDRGSVRQTVFRAAFVVGDRCAASAYTFEDPWTHRLYSSLSAYRAECRGHWPIAKVIDTGSGEWVQTLCWHDGAWRDYDASDPPWERCN